MRKSIKRFLFLANRSPTLAVERAVLYAIGHAVRYHTRLTCEDQHPLPVLRWCNPTSITDNVNLPAPVFSTVQRNEPIIGYCGGGWDLFTEDMRDWRLYASLQERFLDGKKWEETEQYRVARSAIERGLMVWNGCESVTDLREQCHTIDQLYDSIRVDGYQPRTDETRFGDVLIPDELRVGIGRDGSVVRVGGGRHRLLLAQLLDVEKIPVLIMLVHKEWDAVDVHGGVQEAISSVPHLSKDDHPLLDTPLSEPPVSE